VIQNENKWKMARCNLPGKLPGNDLLGIAHARQNPEMGSKD
jgi:hypothetical protein